MRHSVCIVPSLLLAMTVLMTGCATAAITLPPATTARIQRTLLGEERFLRVSMHSTAFFGDASKKLLTPIDPDLVRLLNNPDGTSIHPGAIESTWPVGTPVKLLKIEFPSAWVMARRVLYTPRHLVWIYVALSEYPQTGTPFVLVLRPRIRSEDEFHAELDRLLTPSNPAKLLENLREDERRGVKTKTAEVGMSAEALEMAWGYPDARKIVLEGKKHKETWTWAQGARTAILINRSVVAIHTDNHSHNASSP